MNIYYDKEIDYAEIFFKKCENYGEDVGNGVVVFKNEDDDDVVGYGFESALTSVFNFQELPSRAKVAFLLKATRELNGYTQEQVIKRLEGASGRQYQRAEAGENISLDVLDQIKVAMPEADFSKVFHQIENKIA